MASLSGRSSPSFQNPRQSSLPSAVAIGAKLVSPPLFQSMYSRSRYSASGTSNGASASCTHPCAAIAVGRGWGVSRGISTDQCSAVGQKPSAGRLPRIGGEVLVVTGRKSTDGARPRRAPPPGHGEVVTLVPNG